MPDKKRKKKKILNTTRWSLISMMNKLDSSESRQLREELFRDYWRPIHIFFKNKGLDSDTAQDMTQDFFYKSIIDNDLFGKASKDKGKFRSLLVRALNNFYVSQKRYNSSTLRKPENIIFNSSNLDKVEAKDNEKDVKHFNHAWIQTILENVSERLKKHYLNSGKGYCWEAFNLRVVEPIISQKEAPGICEICQKIGISDENKVSNYIYQVKQKYQKELRNHIREYVNTEKEVSEELTDFSIFLQNLTN